MKNNEIDMLHGPLLGKILKFALPIAASSMLQQLFNSVDVAVVGHFASSEALAAVGANTFLINLLLNLFIGVAVGVNVIIANHIGQHDDEGIAHAVSTSSVIALVSGFLLLIVGLCVSRPVLTLMGTPANVLDDAVLYLRIFFLGVPFLMIYNFGSSILRSKGDTRRPLYILLIAGAVNTLLNLLFVIGFHMSVAGVAIATAIANLFCAIAIVRLLTHEQGAFQLRFREIKSYGIELKRILQIGLPAGVQGMVFSLSNVFVQSSINAYGSNAIAGSSVAQNFEAYCFFLLVAFDSAAVTFIGQCYGAGLVERCKRVFRICFVCGGLSCLMLNLLIYWQADFFLMLFTSDHEVWQYAKVRMTYVLLFQSIATTYEIPSSAMRGLGHSVEPALLTIFGTCVLRLTWIFLVCPILPGFDKLMWVYPISWILTGIMVGITFVYISRKAWAFISK